MPKAKANDRNKAATSRKTTVRPERSIIARSAGLLLTSACIAFLSVIILYSFHGILYRGAGGEIIPDLPAEITFREALSDVYPELSQEELNRISGAKIGTKLYVSHTTFSYWFSQLIINGWVPYAILFAFLTGLLYSLGVSMFKLTPSWHRSHAKDRFENIAEQISELRQSGVENFQEIIKNLNGECLFINRLKKLQKHYVREPDRQLCREANNAYSQAEQTEVVYTLLPLGFLEFILPILGFIGTVLGVSQAVGALRWGMYNLFQSGELDQTVVGQFLTGFDGLVLAFMTTLFGLLGLALTALFRFHLRRNAMAVIAKIDKWSEEVINLLPSQSMLDVIVEGLVVCDENGNPVRDEQRHLIPRLAGLLTKTDENGMPQRNEKGMLDPLLAELVELNHTTSRGIIVHDDQGRPVCDERGQPIPRWTETLVETDENGNPLRDEHGRVIPKLNAINESLQRGLFEPSEEGEAPVPALSGVRSMIEIATEATYGIHNALMKHIYQIVGYDDKDQYTKLTVYSKDEETGETHSVEVQGRLRSERQHTELMATMHILSEEIIEKIGSPQLTHQEPGEQVEPGVTPTDVIPLGRLVIQPAEESVEDIAAGNAAFAVVRSDGQTTSEAELIAGYYEAVMGELRPRENDRNRLPMAVAALGFFSNDGKESTRFGAFLPFAPHDPWLHYGTQELLPAEPLVRCNSSFLSDYEILSSKIACMPINDRQLLLCLACKRDSGETSLFTIPTDGEDKTPTSLADSFEGELLAESVLPGEAYAFAFRSQNMTETVLVRCEQEEPSIVRIHSNDNPGALAFDTKGRLHYTTIDSEVGVVDEEEKSLNIEFELDRPMQFNHIAYSSNGAVYLGSPESGELIIVHCNNSGDAPPEFKSAVYPRIITNVTSTPDGRYVFVGCADGSVYCRNG